MKRIFITGGTGFIGQHIVRQLAGEGFEVRALARKTSDVRGIKVEGVETVEGDVRDAGSLEKALRGAEAVVHAAALVGEWGRARDFQDINVKGTANVLAAMRTAGVRRLIDVSTCSVHGYEGKDRTDETAPHVKTGVLYSDTKVEAEKLVWEAHGRGEVVATAIRPVMVWGPGDRAFLAKLIGMMRSGVFTYIGSGDNVAGLCHARNVAEIIMLAIGNEKSAGEAFLVNDGCGTTYRELAEAIADRMKLRVRYVRVPYGAAKLAGSASETFFRAAGRRTAPLVTKMGVAVLGNNLSYSIEKARRVLRYEPVARFPGGLDEYISWYRGTFMSG
ncbi:MAG: NAD-dependent epimerase/dehydratase family protein [bacterium]